MDQWNTKLESPQKQRHQHVLNSDSEHRESTQVEAKDASAARKVQKADREKLRRERLNDQFIELGNLLDPDRPKNDKASILIDTIQELKDLTTEVNRLKAEYTALSEESCELTLEKNELREEKSSLKSDIDSLNAQYQQRARVMFPWGAIDPSSVVIPPPYSFPVAPLPMHPFPFFGNQNPPPGPVPNLSPAFIPYPNAANGHINPIYAAPTSCSSSKQECGSKLSDCQRSGNDEKADDSSEVVTELELKTPGSRTGQELWAAHKKGKQAERKEKSNVDGSCSSSRQNSSQGFQDSCSNSVVDNNGRSNE